MLKIQVKFFTTDTWHILYVKDKLPGLLIWIDRINGKRKEEKTNPPQHMGLSLSQNGDSFSKGYVTDVKIGEAEWNISKGWL